MPNLYARQTALTNVGGRIDYISSPKRQEHLLAVYDGAADRLGGAYWQTLAFECSEAAKFANEGKKCVEGREIHFMLSNALFERMTSEEVAEILGSSFEAAFHRPCAVGVHFNKKKNNYHAHLIYSERDLLSDPVVKIAERALFFDETGKRQYKKSAVLDENGELRAGCRIVKKGEVYERRYFGAVDQQFHSREWLKNAKTDWLLPLRNGALKGDVEITEYDPSTGKLAQQHVGKKAPADVRTRIEEYNELVKAHNFLVDEKIDIPDEEREELSKAFVFTQGLVNKSLNKNAVLRSQLAKETKLTQNLAYLYRPKIKIKRDWKVQRMIDDVRVAREENITGITDIDERLKKHLDKEEFKRLIRLKEHMTQVEIDHEIKTIRSDPGDR